MLRNQDDFRLALKLTTAVLIGCLVWWLSPAVYTSVVNLLPSNFAPTAQSRAQLTDRIARLQTRIARLETVNRQLRSGTPEGLIATSSLPAEFTAANVIARPPASPYDTLLVDAGHASEITRGAAVWWPPGVYLGEVVDVRRQTAVVRLISSPRTQTVARIDNRLTVEVSGRGGGDMTATLPATAEVATNTPVISDRFNALLGRVVRTQPAPSVGRMRLFIQPIIPASQISHVHIGQQQ